MPSSFALPLRKRPEWNVTLLLAGKWGYACCHSFVRNAYCTGSKGIEAARDAENLMRQNLEVRDEEERQ